jgi:Fe2+ or Zn2+ uptake regulation protein
MVMQQCDDKQFVRKSLRSLRAAGHRMTRPRRLVLEALAARQEPASPYDIEKELHQQGERLGAVTIYRVLELLDSMNLVHRVLSRGGYVRCTLGSGKGCHGYLVCRGCGGIQEFADLSLCQKEDELAARHGFRAERHMTEFSGLCKACLMQEQAP